MTNERPTPVPATQLVTNERPTPVPSTQLAINVRPTPFLNNNTDQFASPSPTPTPTLVMAAPVDSAPMTQGFGSLSGKNLFLLMLAEMMLLVLVAFEATLQLSDWFDHDEQPRKRYRLKHAHAPDAPMTEKISDQMVMLWEHVQPTEVKPKKRIKIIRKKMPDSA